MGLYDFDTLHQPSLFKLYLMDKYGNHELIYSGTYNVFHAQPIRKRMRPHTKPSLIQWPGAEKDGADALLLTGMEAGGHTGHVGTMVVLPAVVNAVDIPVVVGGGIAQPEQFASALCMGAEGIMMGTRFMMTRETPLPPNVVDAILKANEEETYATVHVSGRNQRWLVTSFLRDNYMGLPEVKGEDHYDTFLYRAGKGMVDGDLEEGIVGVGQSVGLVNDIKSIKEVIEWMMEGCEKVLQATAKLVT